MENDQKEIPDAAAEADGMEELGRKHALEEGGPTTDDDLAFLEGSGVITRKRREEISRRLKKGDNV